MANKDIIIGRVINITGMIGVLAGATARGGPRSRGAKPFSPRFEPTRPFRPNLVRRGAGSRARNCRDKRQCRYPGSRSPGRRSAHRDAESEPKDIAKFATATHGHRRRPAARYRLRRGSFRPAPRSIRAESCRDWQADECSQWGYSSTRFRARCARHCQS